MKNHEISFCPGCNCMTKSIRVGKATFICGKCKYDKSLSDIFQWELKNQQVNK